MTPNGKWKKSFLKNNNITTFDLATYACMAINTITTDCISTYKFAEWLGEPNFTTDAPKSALIWARETKAWMIPDEFNGHCEQKMDTTSYEKKIRDHYRESRKLGMDTHGPKNLTRACDLMNGVETIENNIPRGMNQEGGVYKGQDRNSNEEQQTYADREAWYQCRNRGELIRRYFEDKGCPYFLAEDGGNYTHEANGEDRGATGAPYMEANESFSGILASWHERPAVPIAARTYILPKNIGTEATNCGHSEEIAALTMGLDWLTAHDLCLHVLESNATAFNAKAIRDNPTPTMRRRIRGTGVAAGKGECERLREIIGEWKEPKGSDARSRWNEVQKENLAKIVRQLYDMKQPKWPKIYRDRDTRHPIFLVDSHQMEDQGKLTKKRYKELVPCKAFVTANELADKVCMVALGVEKGNLALKCLPTPEDIRYPPDTLRFIFSHLGKTCNGETPTTIETLVKDTLCRAAASKQEQGRIIRIIDKINLSPSIIGRKGAYSNQIRHLAQSHSQNCYRNSEYCRLHEKYGNVPKVESRELQKYLLTQCPFCKKEPIKREVKGNSRHHHVYCENIRINAVRERTLHCLEDILTQFTNAAQELKQIAPIESRLQDDMNKAMNELPLNDCALIGEEGSYQSEGVPITLNTMQWNGIRNRDDHWLRKQAYWFPIACELGLLTSRKEEEWRDEQTCSSDLTYLGAIPNVMENVLKDYCRKATKGVSKELKETCQNKCKSLKNHSSSPEPDPSLCRNPYQHNSNCTKNTWRK